MNKKNFVISLNKLNSTIKSIDMKDKSASIVNDVNFYYVSAYKRQEMGKKQS